MLKVKSVQLGELRSCKPFVLLPSFALAGRRIIRIGRKIRASGARARGEERSRVSFADR